MEIIRRDPDAAAALPVMAASPPSMVRRNTNPARPIKLAAKKTPSATEEAAVPIVPDVNSAAWWIQQVLQFPDGSRYLGAIVAGKKHGKGFMVYCDGSTFEGDFVQGKRCGTGTRTNPDNKDVFRGSYRNDQKHGFGWNFKEDGSESYCFYSCNELQGCGSFRWPRGTVEDREYNAGKLVASREVFFFCFFFFYL